MPPPIRPVGAGSPVVSSAAEGSEVRGSTSGSTPTSNPTPGRSVFISSPLLDLRSDLRNSFRFSGTIYSLGDVEKALVFGFFRDRLSFDGRGVEIVQQLGSFPGFLHPETPVGEWNQDEKPDFNVIGDAEVILRRLAPHEGWSDEVLERNLSLARRGMVYFNPTLETSQGPVRFKMGILDRSLWREGTFYFDLRASMLPDEGSYVFLREAEGFRPGDITPEELRSHVLRSQAELMGRALDTLYEPDSFSAEDLIARRFRHQFAYYERYRRFFEASKGAKQRTRYEREGVDVASMIAPGLRAYLEEHPDQLTIRRGAETLAPDQITTENLRELHFEWRRSPAERQAAYQAHLTGLDRINSEMWAQTKRNIASTRSDRPGYHRMSWLAYGGRKFARRFGIGGERFPRIYSAEASHFETLDQRLGRGDNPISQMIILAGYGPGDENDPRVFRDMADYAEAEIAKGAQPNVLFRGNNPSKFTLPVHGVPAIAYRFMDALRSPAIRDIVVVGTPDVIAVLEAFETHFAEEIAARGKRFIPINTGLEGGGFTKNIQDGLDALPRPGEMSVLSFGDTPRVDIHNVAYYPWRHNMDFILGSNARDLVLDFMGMNAHYQMEMDGVGYPFKEGNVEGLRNFPQVLWGQIFVKRKSVRSGPWGKAGIVTRYLFSRPVHSNPIDTALDVGSVIKNIAVRSVENHLTRLSGRRPPRVAADVNLVERVIHHRVGWRADFRPFHSDMGGLVDLDGIRDYVVAELLSYLHPHAHQEDLTRFAEETLPGYRDRLPLLNDTPKKINEIYRMIYEELLQREAERPTEEKLGITADTLLRMGFDPAVKPFNEGRLNPQWVRRVVSEQELEAYRRAFVAYDNIVPHAQGLQSDFEARIEATVPYTAVERQDVSERVRRFVLRQLNADPERMRGLILEWDFSRLEAMMIQNAQRRFGEFAPEVDQLRTYFRQSTVENLDTPLRRMLTGLKAVDVMRRYQRFLSPAEFQRLYPLLVESVREAREVIPGNRHLGLVRTRGGLADGRFFLRSFLDQARTTADETYVLRVGESPPPYRGRGLAAYVPHSNDRAPIFRDSSGLPRRVDTPVYLQAYLDLMARRLEILPSRIPHLIAAASGAGGRSSLGLVSSERMSFVRLLAWTQSSEGQAFLRNNSRMLDDRWKNRFWESGPGLAFGLASMLGAEYAADHLGLDGRHHPHERFMFVVGASHLANLGTSATTEVLLNRSMGASFDFAAARMVNAGGELGLQFGLEARSSLARALGASWTRSFGLEGGVARMAFNGTRGLALLPFRTAWGMGAGLMSSAIVDQTIGRLFPEGSATRNALHLGAFFLPDLYRIGVGNRGAAFFEGRAMRWGGRAFAAGFIADMLFLGAQRLQYGAEGSATQLSIYQQANRLHDEQESFLRRPVDGLFEMLAPSLAAWWDSVEFNWHDFHFRPNRYQNEVRQDLQRFSLQTSEQAEAYLRNTLIHGTEGQALDPSFYTDVNWDTLRGDYSLRDIRTPDGRELPVEMVFEQLSQSSIHERRIQGRSHEEIIRYIQEQFSGFDLSRTDAEIILDRITAHRIRSNLSQLHQFEMPQNAAMRRLFDARGNLISGQEGHLVRSVFGGQQVSESELLRLRQVALAVHILQLRSESSPAAREDLNRYLSVARRIGIADAEGNLVSGEIQRIAQAQFEAPQHLSASGTVRLALNASASSFHL